ncbi:MAG: hypothetical protein JXL80_04280 [Planctomycetes bacterium]|nr:hypothetical protein [Planctomycetota bacterium]
MALSVLLASLLGAAGCEPKPGQESAAVIGENDYYQQRIDRLQVDGYRLAYSLEGTVEQVATIATHSGRAVLIDGSRSDWIVLVGKIQPLEGAPRTREDGKIAFAVHSPTRLFALSGVSEQWEGQRCRFALMEKPAGEGRLGHRELVVRRIAD